MTIAQDVYKGHMENENTAVQSFRTKCTIPSACLIGQVHLVAFIDKIPPAIEDEKTLQLRDRWIGIGSESVIDPIVIW